MDKLKHKPNIQILDTTLRDGNYAVNFKYSKKHIETIVHGLLDAGIKWIELGHGMSAGLDKKFPTTTVEDINCYEIAREIIGTKSNIGAIVAPALISYDPIKSISELLDFVRIVVTPETLEVAANYIESIKSYNKPIFAQLVKSHLFEGAKFKPAVLRLINAGVDVIYVVDTCGSLIPQQVTQMVCEINSMCSLPIGFHGHNNLSLSVANSLAAIAAGATFIDATVGGIGRGAGNTQIETLLSVLQKNNLFTDSSNSLHRLLGLNEYLQAEFPHTLPGINPGEIAFAHYNLDSTTEAKINAVCNKHGINVYDFLRKLQQYVNHDWVRDEDIENARDSYLMNPETNKF